MNALKYVDLDSTTYLFSHIADTLRFFGKQ